MEYSEKERELALRSIEAVRQLGCIYLGRIPSEFFAADRSMTLLYSQRLAQSTGWDEWVAASREDGFWQAMESAANCVVRRMTGLPAGKDPAADVDLRHCLLTYLVGKPSAERLREIYREAAPIVEADPQFFESMAKVLSRREKAPGAVRLRDCFSNEKDPSWHFIRGWTSHHFWLMTPAARKQSLKALTDDQNKKLTSKHGLVSHPTPPILGIRDGVDEFTFRADWTGVRPKPSIIMGEPTLL